MNDTYPVHDKKLALEIRYENYLQRLVDRIKFVSNHSYDGLSRAPKAYAQIILLMQHNGFVKFALGCRYKLGLNYNKIASDMVIRRNLNSNIPKMQKFGRYLIQQNQTAHRQALQNIANVEIKTTPAPDNDGPHHDLRAITTKDIHKLAQVAIMFIAYVDKRTHVVDNGQKLTIQRPRINNFQDFKNKLTLVRTYKVYMKMQINQAL